MKYLWFAFKMLVWGFYVLLLNGFYWLRFYCKKRRGKFDDGTNNPVEKDGWTLTFQDEFDGDEMDWTKWNKWYSENSWSPDETKAENSLDCIEFKEGYLYLLTKRNDDTSSPYPYKTGQIQSAYDEYCDSSGVFKTKGWEQQYGYYEIRCKPPKQGKLFWAAFWLNGSTWPPEIDIFEFMSPKEIGKNFTKRISHTDHWGTPNKAGMRRATQIGRELRGPDWTKEFHTYACRWEWDYVDFFIDNIKVYRIPYNVPNNKMSILVTNGVGGTPTDDDLPGEFIVDYVRAYKKNY